MMTDLKIVCIAASHIPWALKRRRAYKLCANDLSIFPICSEADRFLEKVTPSIFRLSTLAISESSGGTTLRRLCLGSTKMISLDLVQFSDKLFAVAHVRMLLISACLEDKFEAGMIRYVWSANIHRELPGVTAWRSPVLITYAAGPVLEPGTLNNILAVISWK